MPRKNKAAVELGRRGGAVSSDAKAAAARANGAKGGRPRADGSKPAGRSELEDLRRWKATAQALLAELAAGPHGVIFACIAAEIERRFAK